MNLTIMCDKCGRLVDRTISIRDDFNMTNTIRVYCHGEMDEMVMSDFELSKISMGQLDKMLCETGHAFTATAVPALADQSRRSE